MNAVNTHKVSLKEIQTHVVFQLPWNNAQVQLSAIWVQKETLNTETTIFFSAISETNYCFWIGKLRTKNLLWNGFSAIIRWKCLCFAHICTWFGHVLYVGKIYAIDVLILYAKKTFNYLLSTIYVGCNPCEYLSLDSFCTHWRYFPCKCTVCIICALLLYLFDFFTGQYVIYLLRRAVQMQAVHGLP